MLRFVEHENFYTGTPLIKMEYDGFKLDLAEQYPALTEYNVKSYYIFLKNRDTSVAYDIINAFLKTMTVEEHEEIANAIVLMKGLMMEELEIDADMKKVDEITDTCGDVIDELEKNINFCDRALEWIYGGAIPIADMSNAGSGPHHSVDMTFKRDEAAVIMSILILGKLLTVIFGEFILRFGHLINPQFIESVAYSMYTPLYRRKFPDLIQKVEFYINSLVVNKTKSDPGVHYQGFTPEMTTRKILADFFVKKAGSINLNRPDGNVIKYLASCTKSFIDSQQKNSNNKQIVKTFLDPKSDGDAIGSSEETNSSRMEIESTASRKPMFGPPVSRFAAKWMINHVLTTEGIDRDMYEESYLFYKNNPVTISPITQFLLATYFGPDIGGGASIYNLDAPLALQLAALLQILAAKTGATEMAHVLTMKISSEDRIGQSSDFTFANAWRASPEYAACRKRVSNGFGEINWDVQLRKIVDTLTSKTFIYHTSPVVWEIIGQENGNGTSFNEPLMFMLQTLVLIDNLWTQRSIEDDNTLSTTA